MFSCIIICGLCFTIFSCVIICDLYFTMLSCVVICSARYNICTGYNPLPQDKRLDSSRWNSYHTTNFLSWAHWKAFADNKIKWITIIISLYGWVDNIMVKRENASYQQFLAPLVSLCHSPSSIVCASIRPSIRMLTFSLSIFFLWNCLSNLMKLNRNVPAMVLFWIFSKEFVSFKNSGCHGNKI